MCTLPWPVISGLVVPDEPARPGMPAAYACNSSALPQAYDVDLYSAEEGVSMLSLPHQNYHPSMTAQAENNIKVAKYQSKILILVKIHKYYRTWCI